MRQLYQSWSYRLSFCKYEIADHDFKTSMIEYRVVSQLTSQPLSEIHNCSLVDLVDQCC